MLGVVGGELDHGQQSVPVGLLCVGEVPEQILKHSVDALCLPIRLRMKGSAGELLDT